MKTYPRIVAIGMVLLGMVGAHNAWAATDGSEGNTSSGTTDLTLTVPEMVKIHKIDDLSFNYTYGLNNAAATISDSDDVCVYSNMWTGGSHDYRVTMTGSGASSTFKVTCTSGDCDEGTTDEIDYSAYWNDESGNDTGEAQVGTTGGVSAQINDQTGWSNDLDCTGSPNGGTNARVRVEFAKNDILNNRRAGTYTGTLTILITPTP
jgi:hypothetical protein